MMMKLVNKGNISIQGVCSFMYRGYEISSSNMPGYWDVVAFDNSGQVARDGCRTVEDAIEWVNEQTSDTDAHDLLVELVEVVKTFPAEITGDHDDLGDRIKIYLEEDK